MLAGGGVGPQEAVCGCGWRLKGFLQDRCHRLNAQQGAEHTWPEPLASFFLECYEFISTAVGPWVDTTHAALPVIFGSGAHHANDKVQKYQSPCRLR